jgi:hypothetical protein
LKCSLRVSTQLASPELWKAQTGFMGEYRQKIAMTTFITKSKFACLSCLIIIENVVYVLSRPVCSFTHALSLEISVMQREQAFSLSHNLAPRSPPTLPQVNSTGDTQEDRKRENRKKAWYFYTSLNTLCCNVTIV